MRGVKKHGYECGKGFGAWRLSGLARGRANKKKKTRGGRIWLGGLAWSVKARG